MNVGIAHRNNLYTLMAALAVVCVFLSYLAFVAK